MEDNFQAIDEGSWSYEIQRGGFGSGSFEWTTDDPKNAYVDAEGLHIVPTLTTETTDITLEQLTDNFVLNLTTDGTCTGKEIDSCSVRSNLTAGTIINPVRSARLSTKGKKTLKYGKVEVVAKMPKGDWLWPAIWMMPEADIYGAWPRSGEIDIAESRGNYGDNYTDGRDSLIGALHWGPIAEKDAFYKTSGKHNLRRTDYSEAFHTYGLEWSENYLFTYIDSRLLVSHPPICCHLTPTNHIYSKFSSSNSIRNTITCGSVEDLAKPLSTIRLFSTLGPRPAGPTRLSMKISTSSSTLRSEQPTASSRMVLATSRGVMPPTLPPRNFGMPQHSGLKLGAREIPGA
jgi:Glycosyl hydrolases family 16